MTAVVDPVADPFDNAEIEWIPLNRIIRDERVNTRPVDQGWVARMVPDFDPDALSTLTVSQRPRNQYVVIDGQNRAELVRIACGPKQEVPCRVLSGLSLQQEAGLFRKLNTRRNVLPVYGFLARVTEGEDAATAILKMVEAAGWRITASGRKEGNISAVVSLERIYGDKSKGEGHNAEALASTLRTVTEAWGYIPRAVNGDLLLGIGMIYLRFGSAVDTEKLTRALASHAGGPSGVLGDARGLRAYRGGSIPHCVAEAVVGFYNVGLRSKRLPEWRT